MLGNILRNPTITNIYKTSLLSSEEKMLSAMPKVSRACIQIHGLNLQAILLASFCFLLSKLQITRFASQFVLRFQAIISESSSVKKSALTADFSKNWHWPKANPVAIILKKFCEGRWAKESQSEANKDSASLNLNTGSRLGSGFFSSN
jgi:hypothetical protein